MSRSTSATADSQLRGRPSRSRSTGKLFVSPRTERSGASAERRGVVAAELAASIGPLQVGVRLHAARDAVRAARVETARGRDLGELRHAAWDDGQVAAAAREAG